ncbi:hypothetical protein, partial [Streptomyces sp. NPDC018031]|uniref:hypothetical protein n=1 Tax=Streptomyces sp. NPDC018031 TaxID=3365033 RepID=UPI003790B274
RLLGVLRGAGAEGQAAVLAERAAAHVALEDPDAVARLLGVLREAGAEEQAAVLAARLPAAGHFGRFIKISDHRSRFRFGREPDGSAAPSWAWDDLE